MLTAEMVVMVSESVLIPEVSSYIHSVCAVLRMSVIP